MSKFSEITSKFHEIPTFLQDENCEFGALRSTHDKSNVSPVPPNAKTFKVNANARLDLQDARGSSILHTALLNDQHAIARYLVCDYLQLAVQLAMNPNELVVTVNRIHAMACKKGL